MIQPDKLLAPLHTLRRILPLLWQSSRKWTLLSTLLMALEVVFGLAALFLLKQLVDVVTEMLGAEAANDGLGLVLWYLALTGGCMTRKKYRSIGETSLFVKVHGVLSKFFGYPI
jgi:ATP-binding cassette, subfamily B, bacterial